MKRRLINYFLPMLLLTLVGCNEIEHPTCAIAESTLQSLYSSIGEEDARDLIEIKGYKIEEDGDIKLKNLKYSESELITYKSWKDAATGRVITGQTYLHNIYTIETFVSEGSVSAIVFDSKSKVNKVIGSDVYQLMLEPISTPEEARISSKKLGIYRTLQNLPECHIKGK